MIRSTSLIFIVVCLVTATQSVAQNSDFQVANQLIQQQQYEEALPILQRLYEENRSATIFFDRLIDLLIDMNEPGMANEYIAERFEEGYGSIRLKIRKGKILHLKGEREQAYSIWDELIEENRGSMQFYYQIGNTLMERREYSRAAELYLDARESFDDHTMFINEIANAQMQAGNFTEAMREYFHLIRYNPNQMNFVQQRLLRMQDQKLYETAALEMEDQIAEMDLSHPAYNQMHQLYIWLLTETGQFRRALVAARQYETRSDRITYSLYSLASQLMSNNEHEMAAEAYAYYTELEGRSVYYQAKDQLADLYMQWASYLSKNNLSDLEKREALYRKAYDTGARLFEEAPFYNRRDRVAARNAELALDVFYDRENAQYWASKLESAQSSNAAAQLHYLQGRIELFDGNYTGARQYFTRANRQSEDSNLSEKSRYFLSLTDLFSGDYEFARIQLRSLERRHVSYYANDALKLRMWIQEGERADTTGKALSDFSTLLEKLHRGELLQAIHSLAPMLEARPSPLLDNAVVEISIRSDIRHIPLLYPLVDFLIQASANSPLRERLLWEKAVMARTLVDENGPERILENFENRDLLDSFYNNVPFPATLQAAADVDWPVSLSDIESIYETIIMEFPQGFYAPHARIELQNLSQPSAVQ